MEFDTKNLLCMNNVMQMEVIDKVKRYFYTKRTKLPT
ncbi:MAG: hypothetical protein JSC189_000628 [Candidatus Tokpelaia sp. JSC189]|nr:MAG: hypothetical protein JSC189_000628 [Candidatus Tokpelaia sp. JSC189]